MKVVRCQSAFTLIEMLVVISILGILAALTVPALKSLGKANVNLSATAQFMGDVGHARQLAVANHTTVYMVFVPTNFWNTAAGTFNSLWWSGPPALTLAQQTAATNLCDKQLTGYTFIAYGAVGDQPGNHQWHYLEPWHALPDGTFVASWKFGPRTLTNTIVDQTTGAAYPVQGFNQTNDIPFPTQDSPVTANTPYLPYLAFNYLGQLTTAQLTPAPSTQDEYIPLARGTVLDAVDQGDPAKKRYALSGVAAIAESPAGNSTNAAFNLVQVDWLTGHAALLYEKVQ